MPILSRRATLLGLSGLTCAAALPAEARGVEDWAACLDRDLGALVRQGTRLTLHAFDMDGHPARMSAVVEMTWQPGLRRRRMTATGQTASACYDRLLSEIATTFGSVNPRGIQNAQT